MYRLKLEQVFVPGLYLVKACKHKLYTTNYNANAL